MKTVAKSFQDLEKVIIENNKKRSDTNSFVNKFSFFEYVEMKHVQKETFWKERELI
jgi:hypothetical protein